MTENIDIPVSKRILWLRGFYMLLMMLAFHVSWTVMIIFSVIQFILAVLNGEPNDRLVTLGRSLGSYLGQVTCFLTFASEEIPFPFSDWPSGEGASS